MDDINFSAMPDFTPVVLDAGNRARTIQWAMDLLLHSRDCVPQDALICLEVNRVFLGNGGFVVTAFRPKNQEREFPYLEFLLNLQSLASSIYDNTGIFYTFPMDGQLIVLSCFPRLTREQRRETQLADLTERMAHRVRDLCRKYWNVEVVPVVGPVVYTVAMLSEAYFFVTDLMEYKLFTGDNEQCLYEPAQLHTNELVGNFSEIQNKAYFLANDIYAGLPLDMAQYARELVSFIIDSDVSSLRNVHICLLLFVQNLSQALLRLGVVDTAFLKRQDMLGRLFQAAERRSLVQGLTQTFTEIQTHMQQQERNHSTQKILAARNYIDTHFTDPSLSLEQVSEHVGLHASTVSSQFKKQFGVTVLSYIRRCRVDCAKALLADRKNTLEQVMEGAGFGSLNSMYRAFRVQEGLPPGQLRSQ